MDDIATWLRARAAEETSNDTAAKLWGAADLIESTRSENDRLGDLAKAISTILDAPDRAEAIIDIIADRDSWRDQCSLRDDDNARLAKELEGARKALEPFARDAEVWASFSDGEFLTEFFNDGNVPMETTITVGDLRRAAAIRHKATVTTDDLPEGGSET